MTDPASDGFLGRGWAFPVRLADDRSVLPTPDGAETIRQSIRMILGTAPGERLMRPDFGCGIHDLVFGVNDTATATMVAQSVRDALTSWEPRIDVLDVYAAPDPADRSRLLIEINYQVRSDNSRFNLVYPFYLP